MKIWNFFHKNQNFRKTQITWLSNFKHLQQVLGVLISVQSSQTKMEAAFKIYLRKAVLKVHKTPYKKPILKLPFEKTSSANDNFTDLTLLPTP